MGVAGVQVRPKANIFNADHVKIYYGYLLEIVRAKGKLVVKNTDIGSEGRGDQTRFGIMLRKLEVLGFARRLNHRKRPKKYELVPRQLWEHVIMVCSLDCERGDSLCGLYGLCPYHALLRVVSGDN